MLSAGEIVADRFACEAMIGRGGLSAVYRVRHLQLQTTYALKILLLQRPGISRRLLLEGQIQARIRHPNVVSVIDVVEHDGHMGLVMEYIAPPSLAQWLISNGPMAPERALSLFVPVLSAVIYAHDQGVLHRDLKPANILLARGVGGVVPKVADFGIAKVWMEDAGVGATLAGMPLGTPGYMPPEQIQNAASADTRADQFALGAVLFEMMVGHPPFTGADVELVMDATLNGDRPTLLSLVPGCPPEIAAAVERALSTDPAARFPDVRALAEALTADRPELIPLLEPTEGRSNAVPMTLGEATLPDAAISTYGSGPSLVPGTQNETVDPPTGPRPSPPSLPPARGVTVAMSQVTVAPSPAVAVPTQSQPSTARQALPWTLVGALAVVIAGLVVVLVRWSPSEPAVSAPSTAAVDSPTASPAPPGPSAPSAPAGDATPTATALPETATASSPDPHARTRPEAAQAAAPEASPGVSTPDVSTPSVSTPAVSTPGVATPAVSTPGVETPEVTTPEVTTPGVGTPTVAAPSPEAAPPNVVAAWEGRANNRPFLLTISSQDGTRIRGEATFQLGTAVRTFPVQGEVSAEGKLSFAEIGGEGLRFRGSASGGMMSGEYMTTAEGRPLRWSVSR